MTATRGSYNYMALVYYFLLFAFLTIFYTAYEIVAD